ncbi:MAG: phosphatase PAP2 family protein [Gammaproteobacteria bacterium]
MICNQAPYVDLGNAILGWIAQNLRSNLFDALFLKVSMFGEMLSMLLIMSSIYWFWDREKSRLIIHATLTSLFANNFIKLIFAECRPPSDLWLEVIPSNSFSFPSGHAQVTIVLFAGLAYYSNSKLIAAAFWLTGILVGLSRLYLGVHYLHDVIIGLVLGLSILALFIFGSKYIRLLRGFEYWIWTVFWLFLLGATLIAVKPAGIGVTTYAVMLGFWLGSRVVSYQRTAPFNLISLMVGFGGILLLRNGINEINFGFEGNFAKTLKFIQYFSIGLWISLIAPKVFANKQFSRD